MTFRGDIASIGLADVFQNLKNNRQTGTLKLYTPDETEWIYFHEGEIACAAAGDKPSAASMQLLVDSGLVTEDRLRELLGTSGNKTLTDILISEGVLSNESLLEGLRGYTQELVLQCFTWERAMFEFAEGPPPEQLFPEPLCVAEIGINTESLMMEAARRMDEWSEIKKYIPSMKEMYVLTQDGRAAIEEWEENEPAGLVAAGFRQPEEIGNVLEEHRMSRFEGGRMVAYLLQQQFVRPFSTEELIGIGDSANCADDYVSARRLFERVLDREPGNTEAREKLSHALGSMGKWEEAASQSKILAQKYREAGNIKKAIAAYEQAVSFVPNDISAQEILVDLYVGQNRREKAIKTSQTLELAYTEIGMPVKAVDTYRKILKKWPKETEVNIALGESFATAGRNAEATAALRVAARLHQRAGNEQELRNTLERILELDPNDLSTSRRLKKVEAGAFERKRVLKQYAYMAVVVLVILSIIGFFAFREVRALLDERTTLIEVSKLLAADQYDAAADRYKLFAARHPFTLASLDSAETLKDIRKHAERAKIEAGRNESIKKLKPKLPKNEAGDDSIIGDK
jgi:tetratricopeptide (TPR) repeat protein